ncbi:LysE family translocator [Streptomyces sp. NPDC046716]|uniref:LysE family translocator n=1 Tax=Streptomyces sp. NPDC046716 TaxID=3157093 RepID=UPI0033E32891
MPNLLGFLGVVMVAYLVPGPDFLVIVRAGARDKTFGRAAAWGAQSGLCVHMCAAALGLSVIAARSAYAFTVIKLAGAAYLVFLGGRALLAARSGAASSRPHRGPVAGHERPKSFRSSFTEGFLTNVLNPKAALFFLSVLPQFVGGADGSTTGQIFLLGVVDIAVGVAYWFALVEFAARLRPLLTDIAKRRIWDRISGALLIGIGVGIAATD